MFLTRALLCSLAVTFVPACDSKPAETPPPAKEDAKQAEEDAAIAKRREEREAKEKAAEEAKAKAAAALEAVCVLPEKMPKDVVAACDAVGKAQDEFMQRVLEGEELEAWTAGKDNKLPMTIVQCNQADSLKVAACQQHALSQAGPELKDSVKGIMTTCMDKFAGKKKGGPMPGRPVPPKPG